MKIFDQRMVFSIRKHSDLLEFDMPQFHDFSARFCILSCLWIGMTGCRPKQSVTPVELPLQGQTVELVVPVELSLPELWQPLIDEWRAQTGADVIWSEYPAASPPWTAAEKPATATNGGRIVVSSLRDLAEAESAGFLTPLSQDVLTAIEQQDLFSGLKEAVLSRQKKLIALPVSAPVLLCYYRKDLLEAAGRTPPATWDEYQALLDDLPNWAPGLTALEPAGSAFRANLFLARSAAFARHPQNYSIWFDIQNGLPLFDSPAFEKALAVAKQAWAKMPAEIWKYRPADCRSELLRGKAALVLAFEPSSAYPQEKTLDGVASEQVAIGVCQLPGSREVFQRDFHRWEPVPADETQQPGFVGFSGLVIGAFAESPRAAAWNLLTTISGRLDAAFAERPRSVCRESESLSGFGSAELSTEANSLVTDATAQTLRSRNLACDFNVPGGDEIRSIIAEELANLDREPAAILAAIQSRLITATEGQREEIRDAYRRSVGLAPLKTAK